MICSCRIVFVDQSIEDMDGHECGQEDTLESEAWSNRGKRDIEEGWVVVTAARRRKVEFQVQA